MMRLVLTQIVDVLKTISFYLIPANFADLDIAIRLGTIRLDKIQSA